MLRQVVGRGNVVIYESTVYPGAAGEVNFPKFEAIVLAVAHRQFCELGTKQIRTFGRSNSDYLDIKSIPPKYSLDVRF